MIPAAVDQVRKGGVVAYPTETFYGLGVDAQNREAIERLVTLKGREPEKPIPVLVPSVEYLETLTSKIPPLAQKLMRKFWPGPLTLVLPAPTLSQELANERGSVGFRISSHPMAKQLLEAFGGALTTTSANTAGQPPSSSEDEVRRYFTSLQVHLLDGGTLPAHATPSTVIEFTSANTWIIHREGAISAATLEAHLSGETHG